MSVSNYAELKVDVKRRMDSAVEVLKKEFGGLRTGRAATSLLDPVVVDAYGSSMPLNQVGNVGVPEPRMITVQVWDKGMVKAVEKAIRDAGLGLNPSADGSDRSGADFRRSMRSAVWNCRRLPGNIPSRRGFPSAMFAATAWMP